ncbi:MAG: FtsQ-type POTRA domain-containing protein [Clostridia bacterium]|nr:FtsQ-type POTRA domain-containing protein [Clostridia bacterium]
MAGHDVRRRRRRTGRVVLLLTALCIVAGVALFPQFRCRSVLIEGVRVLDEEAVAAASGLSAGQHLLAGLGPDPARLLALRYGRAEDAVRALSPYVKSVRARLDFPYVIRIIVEERVEVAYLAIPDGCVVIDAQGIAVELLHEGVPVGIPVVEGATVTSVALGQPLQVADDSTIHGAIVIMDAIIKSDGEDPGFSLFGAVSGLRAVSGDTVYMTVVLPATGESLVVRIGSLDSIAETVGWLRNAIEGGYCDHLGKGVLDLSGEQKVFRPDG